MRLIDDTMLSHNTANKFTDFCMVRLFLAIIIAAILSPAHAEPAFPPGIRIGLEVAGDLRPAPNGSGFQDSQRNVSVLVAEMPTAAYDGLDRTFFGKTSGTNQVAREAFPFRDGIGYLHTARVNENGATTWQWVLLAKLIFSDNPAEHFVALVNVTVPEAARDIYSDSVVRDMLASVTIRPTPIEERLGLIPFKLGERAGFRVLQVQPEGVVLTDGPSDDIDQQPYVIVTIGRAAPEQAADRQRMSRDLLLAAPLRGLVIRSGEDMRISGRAGNEIRATAKDGKGNDVSVVQWIKFLGGSYLRIIAASPTERWDETFNRFRAVRDGIDLR